MLFSREAGGFINRYFEAVWETIRPVPLVHIDFGNGTLVTRTLHGNIATSVCTADDQVLDILPGIYTPTVYLDRLKQFRLLAQYVDALGKEHRNERLRDYHRGQAEALAKEKGPARFVDVAPITKMAIERPVIAALVDGARAQIEASAGNVKESPRLDSAEDIANWKLLADDTQVNETVRRRQIHEKLSGLGRAEPSTVTKWLYKEVLHADLDDPYLGLGSALFANYPFKDKAS